jgi:hypothetical protein
VHQQNPIIAQNKHGTIHSSAHFRERIGARPASFEFCYLSLEGSKRPQAERGDPDQEAASWLEKSSEVERGGSLRFDTKIHSTGEGPYETVAEKTRPSAEPAARGDSYKIKYHRGTSQIHHQAAPSRAQAAGAVVIGWS